MVNYNKQFDLKTSWERTTDKKIQSNTIQRRVESLLRQQQYSLEERRDRYWMHHLYINYNYNNYIFYSPTASAITKYC